jgi:hypothetical protein
VKGFSGHESRITNHESIILLALFLLLLFLMVMMLRLLCLLLLTFLMMLRLLLLLPLLFLAPLLPLLLAAFLFFLVPILTRLVGLLAAGSRSAGITRSCALFCSIALSSRVVFC